MQDMVPFSLRPSFIPPDSSWTSVVGIAQRLEQSAMIERELAERLLLGEAGIARNRAEAYSALAREAYEYAQRLREMQRTEPPTFSGYAIRDRVLVSETGGLHGYVEAFEPMFEPTHIVVLMDNGCRTRVPPHRLYSAKES